jgi:hypothetical protein
MSETAEFVAISWQADVDEAFAECVANARHEFGHGERTVSILEKDRYMRLRAKPVPEIEAMTKAYDLIDQSDWRVADNRLWACALPLCKPDDVPAVDGDWPPLSGWLFFGMVPV